MPFALSADPTGTSLGGKPICEPSSAVILQCATLLDRDVQADCILIADNEKKRNLYVLPIVEGEVQTGDNHLKKIELQDQKVSDIEALTILPNNRILAVGSHSRNNACQVREERRRLAILEQSANSWIVDVRQHPREGGLRCKDILNWSTRNSAFGRLVCVSLQESEGHADSIEHAHVASKGEVKRRCEVKPSLNIEGSTWHDGHVWIGLRAPVVIKEPDQAPLAILLRLKKRLKSIKSNGVALVDLDGWGIRELRNHSGSIWLIAGPLTDSRDEFKLYKFSDSALKRNALIKPEFVRSLPTSAEGLAFRHRHAVVVIDGDENDCRATPGSYHSFELSSLISENR